SACSSPYWRGQDLPRQYGAPTTVWRRRTRWGEELLREPHLARRPGPPRPAGSVRLVHRLPARFAFGSLLRARSERLRKGQRHAVGQGHQVDGGGRWPWIGHGLAMGWPWTFTLTALARQRSSWLSRPNPGTISVAHPRDRPMGRSHVALRVAPSAVPSDTAASGCTFRPRDVGRTAE